MLAIQSELADVGFSLDCFITPNMPPDEADLRCALTLDNAIYALHQRGKRFPHLRLFGVIQAVSGSSAAAFARVMLAQRDETGRGFDGLAIGGLVPYARDLDHAAGVVAAVRDVAPDMPIHVFGIGQPASIRRLVAAGATSSDSSAYARDAVRGRSWLRPEASIEEPALGEALQLALEHLDALC